MAPRAAPLQGSATRRRSRTTTTCRTASTRSSSGPRWPTRARSSPRAHRRSRRLSTRSSTSSAARSACSPGDRLLDVGCGWGGMVMHAAEHYGVEAIGVTLSAPQAEWAQRAIAERGLGDSAEVRFGDYRDVTETGLRRGVVDRAHRAHRGEEPRLLLQLPVTEGEDRGTAAQPHDHARLEPPEPPRRKVHRPLRLPRRRARGAGDDRLGDARPRLRAAPRGEPARALRDDAARVGRQPRARLERGRRRGRPAQGADLAPLHGVVALRVRPQHDRAAPVPRRAPARRRALGDAAAARLGGRPRPAEPAEESRRARSRSR